MTCAHGRKTLEFGGYYISPKADLRPAGLYVQTCGCCGSLFATRDKGHTECPPCR